MPRFFVPSPLTVGDQTQLTGADARHIATALRTRTGESLTLCDGSGSDYSCVVTAIDRECVTVRVEAVRPTVAEPSLRVTLYMGLPKGDKMELVIQKAVELGVYAVVPVAMSRSIVRLQEKDAEKKAVRWQRIADEAAGQSGRGIQPTVEKPLAWRAALQRLAQKKTLLCYEGGGQPLGEMITPADRAVSLVVGPEGGIDPVEAQAVIDIGGQIVTLGPRILRCETAPLAALAVVMERSGNMR